MKYGWRLVLIPLWASCVAGAVVIAALAVGLVSWIAFAVAGVIGLIVGVPAGIWNAKYMRREDPHWRNGRPVGTH
ncbi:hypothetical protein [Maritimibacter sp. DP1N21-5]|uniref:hypothetical protein n=1 Tax=Maritimibacter sp. DP1N21-5 TaxID=2836867 RepID=UPI001C472963|nr:hypothetical protein [Maritimibacter sp. DP1N21-5]MBV7408027.1 hypothetical protein [Maritimibacter sp. DP1N21-5]